MKSQEKSNVYGIVTLGGYFLIRGYSAKQAREKMECNEPIFFCNTELAAKVLDLNPYDDLVGKTIKITEETVKFLELKSEACPHRPVPFHDLRIGENPVRALSDFQEEKADLSSNSENLMNHGSDLLDEKNKRRLERWKIRCKILDMVKKNDDDGLGFTQLEIAKMCGTKKTIVNKVSQLYSFNNNLTYEDLLEKKRGPSPDLFATIPEDVYKELCFVMETKTPVELNINYAWWTAEAVQMFFKQKGYDVKLSYVYFFCERLKIALNVRKRKKDNDD